MKLTLEQAIGQKLLLSFSGYELPSEITALLQRQHVGGVCLFRAHNVSSPAQVRALTAALQQAAAQSGQPPLLIAADQEGGQLIALGGGTTAFPGNLALGATGSYDLARRVGYASGRELAALGLNVNFAPVTDVNTNPQNPVVDTRSFGEDPLRVARLSGALIEGLQAAGVAATAKHFPGHGGTEGDSHHGLPVAQHDRRQLDTVDIPPFQAAIDANVRLIMTAHVAFRALEGELELPATLSAPLLRGLLRTELGFQGLVVSDALNMAPIGSGAGLIVDAIAATAAGVDLLLLHEDPSAHAAVYSGLRHAARRGLLPQAEVLTSAARVLALKRRLVDCSQPPLDVVGCAEHQRLAQEIAARSVTLLRDDARLLPLALAPEQRIAVVVPQTADLTPADTSSYERCTLAQALGRRGLALDEIVVPLQPTADDIAAVRRQVEQYGLAIIGTINAAQHPGQAELVNSILRTSVPTVVAALRMPGDLQTYPSAPTYLCTYSILPPSMEALAQALLGEIACEGRLPISISQQYPAGSRLESGSLKQRALM